MNEQVRETQNAFVIRIRRQAGKPGWTGWVQHAPTGESAAVQNLEALLAFVEHRAGKLGGKALRGLR